MNTNIIASNNGWVVKIEEDRYTSYLGRDGYYAKQANQAMPFNKEKEAIAAALKADRDFFRQEW